MKRRVLTEEERKARKKESTRISDKKRRSAPEYKEKQKVHNQTYYKKNPEKHRKKNETYYDNNRPALILYAKNKRAKVKATKGNIYIYIYIYKALYKLEFLIYIHHKALMSLIHLKEWLKITMTL
jgi:hypothetical protein